jgi:hypothetical protein
VYFHRHTPPTNKQNKKIFVLNKYVMHIGINLSHPLPFLFFITAISELKHQEGRTKNTKQQRLKKSKATDVQLIELPQKKSQQQMAKRT